MIRERLHAGAGRRTGGVLAGIACFFAVYHSWECLTKGTPAVNPLDAGQKVAFVAAAFSVTAYNLRTRVLDLILKIDGSPARIGPLCSIARACGQKLTNLVILFTLTAFLLGAGGFIPMVNIFAKWYASFAAALFAMSIIHFVYVLFAFERLERFMLEDAEEKAAVKEADRLTG